MEIRPFLKGAREAEADVVRVRARHELHPDREPAPVEANGHGDRGCTEAR